MIDFETTIWFLDDRRKDDSMYRVEKILWSTDTHYLCAVICHIFDQQSPFPLDPTKWQTGRESEPFLVDRATDSVLNANWDSYNATNNIDGWRPFGWRHLMTINITGYSYRNYVIVVGGSGKALIHEPDPNATDQPGKLLTPEPVLSLGAAMEWIDARQ